MKNQNKVRKVIIKKMSIQYTIRQAIKLLYPFSAKYHNELCEMRWIEDSEGDTDYGDFCDDCVDTALFDLRKKYLMEQRKKEIQKRDDSFLYFRAMQSQSLFELEDFRYCDCCNKPLQVVVLPTSDLLKDIIESVKENLLTDETCYKAHMLLYNEWGSNPRHQDERKYTIILAKEVVKLLKK